MTSNASILPVSQTRRLVYTSVLLFIAAMVTNVANYALQVLLGRILGPVDYGLYNALLSTMVVLSIPVGTMIFVVNKKVAECRAHNQPEAISALYRRILVKSLKFSALLALLVALSGPWIAGLLNVAYGPAVLWLAPAVMVAALQPLNVAFSQGLQDFRWVAIGSAASGPLRLLTSVSAALLGWGVAGTIGAAFVAGILGWLLTAIPLRALFRTVAATSRHNPGHLVWGEILPVLVSATAFSLMTQTDMLIVKSRFTPEEAGLYASAALLGKAVMYIPGAVVLGLMPMVANQSSLQRNTLGLLKTAILLTLLFSGCGALILFAVPRWVMLFFFGQAYGPAALLLKFFGIAMIPLALVLVIQVYLIARGVYSFSYILLAGALTTLGLIGTWSTTTFDVILVMGMCGILVASVGIVICLFPTYSAPCDVVRERTGKHAGHG